MKVVLYVIFAMTALASNAFFTRLALTTTAIDYSAFAFIRVLSAALIVLLMLPSQHNETTSRTTSWLGSFFLIVFLFSFTQSFTYLPVTSGSIIIFGIAQAGIIFYGLVFTKNQLNASQWFATLVIIIGSSMAVMSFINGAQEYTIMIPPLIAGFSWAVFTQLSSLQQFSVFALRNVFIGAAFLALILLPVASGALTPSYDLDGIVYALLCGTLTTGLAYCLWCLLVPSINQGISAFTTVSVPVIAIVLGVTFLSEKLSTDYLSAAALIFVGVLLYALSDYLKTLEVKE